MPDAYLHPEAAVSTAWLADHLDDPRLRIFECTTYLHPPTEGTDAPYTVVSGRVDYEAGHLPGAGFLDIQAELSDAAGPSHLRFTMPSAEALAAAFAARGIGADSRVVLYARAANQWATRVWWMLRSVGFDQAAVLDGGFEKWQSEGRALDTGAFDYPAASLAAHPRQGLFVGKDAVLAAMDDGETCIINALAADLHAGENPRYGRPGHIPGSTNVPAASLVDTPDGTFVPAARASEAFARAGVTPDRPIIVYCGGGIAATLDAFLLHRLGHQRIAVYDASMSEWARDPALPIEVG